VPEIPGPAGRIDGLCSSLSNAAERSRRIRTVEREAALAV